MAAIVMLTAVMTACSSDEDDVNDNEGICLNGFILEQAQNVCKSLYNNNFDKPESILLSKKPSF